MHFSLPTTEPSEQFETHFPLPTPEVEEQFPSIQVVALLLSARDRAQIKRLKLKLKRFPLTAPDVGEEVSLCSAPTISLLNMLGNFFNDLWFKTVQDTDIEASGIQN